jgi:hypothetical protein
MMNVSERVAVGLAALRMLDAIPYQERLWVMDRAMRLPTLPEAMQFLSEQWGVERAQAR